MAQTSTIKTVVDQLLHGKAIRPKPSDLSLTGSQYEEFKVTVEAEGTETIDLSDKGTIKGITLWCADGIEDITATINAADELNVEPLLLLGTGITSLVLNNASTTDDWEVYVFIEFA